MLWTRTVPQSASGVSKCVLCCICSPSMIVCSARCVLWECRKNWEVLEQVLVDGSDVALLVGWLLICFVCVY